MICAARAVAIAPWESPLWPARRQMSARPLHANGTLSALPWRAILQVRSRRWLMITIEITAGLLLAFFWAFWVFAFGGWWCGGGC
jgi:hypothetical protein